MRLRNSTRETWASWAARPEESYDFKPRPDDIFQERLYCIQWITQSTLGTTRSETYFATVKASDLERERKVEHLVETNFTTWQRQGLVPDMEIEPGYNTDQPIRERGWRYWHHLFSLNICWVYLYSGSWTGEVHLSLGNH